MVQKHIDEALEELGEDEDETPVPTNLKARIAAEHKKERTATWDSVLMDIVKVEEAAG